MNRHTLAALVWLGVATLASAAPVRVSFLDTDAAREDTLNAFAQAGCDTNHLAALRRAITHYYRTPLALDTSAFPPARDGFRDFASIADFISTLGTNQLSFLDHPFELNCFHAALLLAGPKMDVTAKLETRGNTYVAVQVTTNFNEWAMPVTSLADIYALAHPDHYETLLQTICGMEFSPRHRTLLATFYQFHPLPLSTSSNTIAAETQAALRHHWQRCGIQFPANLSLIMLHRARSDYPMVVTDHMGVLLKQKNGYLYFEKTGGKGPFLRLDVQDPADIAVYFRTGTFPDYPFNYMSINDTAFLDVPLHTRLAPFSLADHPLPASSTADRAKQAIHQHFNAISPAPLDARGYAPSAEQNLLPGVRLADLQPDYAQGSGSELAGKFRAAHSSSALAANTFGPWRTNPHNLILLGHTGFTSLQFEKKCPTGLGGIPPNLDLLVENSNTVIGVESKFLEILTPKPPHFSNSYRRENLPQMEECWARLLDDLKRSPPQYLDAAQLVRHYLGLRNQPEFKAKKILLLYLFWEPENWADFPEYRQHRAEIAAFQNAVQDSEVTFVWSTYPDLWNQWDALGFAPDHLRELRKRYQLPI